MDGWMSELIKAGVMDIGMPGHSHVAAMEATTTINAFWCLSKMVYGSSAGTNWGVSTGGVIGGTGA